MNCHLIGIGGVGMAGLAALLKNRAHSVSGCDVHLGARTEWLETLGIRVFEGHDPRHLDGVEQVIVTPAVHPDNPEFAVARNVRYRGDVLAELVSAAPDSIAVCGSHGKTTTATWIAKLLIALGEEVEWAIGGETRDFPVAGLAGSRVPRDRVLIVEADESDGTLAKYRAKMLVVTNCEYDHPDHFKTREEYVACYDAARRNAGVVIEGEVLGGPRFVAAADDTEVVPAWFQSLPEHNRKNARMAMEVALRRGHALDAVLAAMPEIVAELPDRRFQIIWPVASTPHSSLNTPHSTLLTPHSSLLTSPLITVVTDYAHHPTEMKCAVGMARRRCGGKLRVMFQPHRYSRTKSLLKDFPAAFDGADEVVLCPTYAAFERPLEGGTSADLYRTCRDGGSAAAAQAPRYLLAQSCEEAWTHLKRTSRPGDLILILGAGDLLFKLTELPPRRVWIGAGSNTWKSDLDLPIEYVRTQGPADRPGASLGIPWMAGIPGTIGGWVKMNAGAFGHSISEVLAEVKIDGTWVPASECGFGYRTSKIGGEIQDVHLTAIPQSPSAADYLARRKQFPAGTKGSVFKNPPNDFAGRLLESAGVKGMRVGGAFVWDGHANVIVSGPGASNSDFLSLMLLMRNRVLAVHGIGLIPEIQGFERLQS